jgi:hypothetical protein
VIRKIWDEGGEVIKQKIAFHQTEEEAFQLEILLIGFFGRENLTNLTDGGEGASYGNRHAALPFGKRGRINWTQGLSGEELAKTLKHLGAQDLSDVEARSELRKQSERLFEEWLNSF